MTDSVSPGREVENLNLNFIVGKFTIYSNEERGERINMDSSEVEIA